MIIFVNVVQPTLLFVTACIAAISSAVAMTWCIREEDASLAWFWAVVFALSALVAAWNLWWRLV